MRFDKKKLNFSKLIIQQEKKKKVDRSDKRAKLQTTSKLLANII